MIGVIVLYQSVSTSSNLSQKNHYWNNIIDEKLLQTDTILKYFVNICINNLDIIEQCLLDFGNIWNNTSDRDLDWDKIDSFKRMHGYVLKYSKV